MKLSGTFLLAALFLCVSTLVFTAPAAPPHRSPTATDGIWVGIGSEASALLFEDVDFIVKGFLPYEEPLDRLNVEMVGQLEAIPTGSAASVNTLKSGGLLLVALETSFALPRNTRLRWNGAGAATPPVGCAFFGALVDGCTMNGVAYRSVTLLRH